MGVAIRRVQDVAEAEQLWNQFSSNQIIFNDWNFRYCFYKYFKFELYFYVASEEGKEVGLLPLQLNSDTKQLEFFGGGYMEDNQAFVLPGYESVIAQLYGQISSPAHLSDIVGEDAFTAALPVEDNKYILPLAGLTSSDDYIQNFYSSDSRQSMRKKVRRMEKESLEIRTNELTDIDLLFAYNIASFQEDSTFHWPYRQEIFRDLLQLPVPIFLFTFLVNGKPEAVSLSCQYGDYYEYLATGINYEVSKYLSTYVNLKNINQAISVGAKWLDAGVQDCGWKEQWHFSKVPQHVFHKE